MYLNIWNYKNDKYPFQIFIGGRGTGKTYSALRGALHGECDGKFLLMRRTAQELDIMLDSPDNGEGANPFKPVNRDCGCNYGMKRIVKNLAGVYARDEDEAGKLIHYGAPLGYGIALSTVGSIRGIDFSDCSDWIYDEFIPEMHVRKLKEEGSALLNAYETVNRNREFDGKPPIRLWLLANSNNIYNPVFVELGLVNVIERMISRGRSDRYDEARGLAIHLVNNNADFVQKKSATALYKLTEGTRFHDMALNNEFSYNDFSLVETRPLKGYRPVCSVNDAYIYQKKGSTEYYVSYSAAQCPHFDAKTEQDRRLFMRLYGLPLMPHFMAGNIIFESYDLKAQILDIIL